MTERHTRRVLGRDRQQAARALNRIGFERTLRRIICEGVWTLAASILHACRDGDRWLWAIYMNGHVPQIKNVPISDLAVTLDEAASQFKQSYEAMRTKAGLPRPQR